MRPSCRSHEGVYKCRILSTHCVPLYLTRNRSESGVKTLIASFQGHLQSNKSGECGIVAGINTAVVILLDGENLKHVVDYFVQKGDSVQDATHSVEKLDAWYGVVDGSHR